MITYDLYLESGPRHKTTMVHILGLLGCIATGRTTGQALTATPDAIRAFQRFLVDHGESADAAAPFETRVAEHITEGYFLGSGDNSIDFAPDLEPLRLDQLAVYTRRLAWLHADLLARVADLDAAAMAAKPARGRPIGQILAHVLGAESYYTQAFSGPVDGLNALGKQVERGEIEVRAGLAEAGTWIVQRLEGLTEADLGRAFQRGQALWTAHKGLRRLLEHAWEHLREVETRLAAPPA